jgi:hypothetical protein
LSQVIHGKDRIRIFKLHSNTIPWSHNTQLYCSKLFLQYSAREHLGM